MTVVNLREAQQMLGFKTPFTLRKAIKDGHLGAYLRSGPDRRCIYLELTPAGLPTLREQIQHHVAFHGNSPLWDRDPKPQGNQKWTEVANGYLDLPQWGPPPWTELQWATLRNVIELAEET